MGCESALFLDKERRVWKASLVVGSTTKQQLCP